MLQGFDSWSTNRSETNTFSDLEGARIGIDASFYLNRLLSQSPSKEPLLPALGGLPFSLRANIENELQVFTNHNITPLFVFNGLDLGKRYQPFRASDNASRLHKEAWNLYDQRNSEKAVDTFGKSGMISKCQLLTRK